MLDPLPIDAHIPAIQNALERHRAVVVVAEPGAGKTTRVPPALLTSGPAILLQPRRAAARAIARRIATERNWTLGVEVGWHVRLERRFTRDTQLLVATEGILTARLQQDPLLSAFRTIILDEFHERSIHADLAIALSKQAMVARDDLRVVVMSATLDAERVAAYLGSCDIVRVHGRLYPLTIHHTPHLSATAAVASALSETTGNILCFQPGAFEIRRTLDDLSAHRRADVEMFPLYGSLSAAEQDLALGAGPRRRVIVCTNMAETSVTVPGVTAVVDSGLEKVARYDAELAIDSLVTERITQAAAEQRAGRAGRLGPGLVYRLWPATDRLRPFRQPDIHRIDLSSAVLDVAGWGGNPRTLDWFDVPREESLEAAIALLNRMQALEGTRLTDVGRKMLRLPLHPRLARVLTAVGASRQALRSVALLSERHQWPARAATTTSDVLSALDRWDECPPHVRAFATELEQVTRDELTSSGAGHVFTEESLRRALLAGYPDRVAKRREPHEPRFLLSTGTGAVLGTDTGVRDADYIVALDVQAPTRANDVESRIRLASAIELDWLTPTSTDRVHLIDERGQLRARDVRRYDAITLAEHIANPDPETAATLLADTWLEQSRTDEEQQLLRRLHFAGLVLDLPSLVAAAAYGRRNVSEIRLAEALPRDATLALERDAPDSIAVPSGRRARLSYGDDGSVTAAVKLQELFGLADTPRVGPARVPVLLSLLAPNGRPVQLTRDLRSFWDRTYPEVRKELRGRYPKHPWPEDPWNAVATHRAKPRG